MIGFDFLRPELVWLLLLAPVAFLAGWAGLARSRAELARWVSARQERRFLPGWSRGRALVRLALGAVALLFLGLAAVGPVRGYTYRAVSRKGLDLVLCLDTSRSMLAQDLRPSRLERAKREIVGLLDRLAGDRVALIAFSGDAREVSPLTRDRETLTGLLQFVSPEDNQEGGTNLAAPIEMALSNVFDGRTGAHEAIVLLTDGEDLAGKAAAQAEEARKRNIRVFVVGLGTEGGGKIPIVDAQGNTGFLRDPDDKEVVSKLDGASLVALARGTGGDYLSAEQSPTPLEDLYRARIARIEGREIEGGERRVPYDRFQWPLALALACLVLELGLRERRATRADDSSGAPRLAAAFLPLVLLGGEEPFSYARSLANAVRRHEAGEPEAAELAARAILEHADELALSDAQRAKAHFALGVIAATRASETANAEEGEALRAPAREAFALARALAGPGELRLDATYDLGALELFHAENVRATIPEISGQPAGAAQPQALPGAPGTPGALPGTAPTPSGTPQPAAGEPADPLKEARELYGAARDWFVERLRLEWNDEDTRANLELIQRRLHELDAIEKRREEEKDQQQQDQDQKDQKDQKDPQDQKDQQKDPKESEDQQDGKDSQDPEQKDSEKKDEPPKPEEESQEPEQDEKPPEQPEAQPPPPDEGQPPAQAPKPEKPSERVLTREEVMQLLDKLAELEKQQKALDAALRAKKRAGAKRDW